MFRVTRLLRNTTCRRLPCLTPAAGRLPHPATPTACLHTHQRLHQDNVTAEPGGGGPEVIQEAFTPGEASSTDDVATEKLANLGLGKSFIPPASTDSLVFDGIPYNKLHIITIKASYNNTIISLTDYKGVVLKNVSAGTEGFKNAKQGTTVAGQTVGTAAAKAALSRGVKNVRVLIKGVGPGRQTSIKGLQLGGIDIVSITDRTGIPQNGDRPRKARRL